MTNNVEREPSYWDTLDVQCPKCQAKHRYLLAVYASTSYAWEGDALKPVKKELTRIFTCPTTNEEFQAVLSYYEDDKSKFHIIVKGIDDGSHKPRRVK